MKETYEDYLKSIYIISKSNKCGWVSNSEIADFMNVKPSSVTYMLHNLKELELIDWNPSTFITLRNNIDAL
jgi:Mn-dependent DtxR family transcriptional regulator